MKYNTPTLGFTVHLSRTFRMTKNVTENELLAGKGSQYFLVDYLKSKDATVLADGFPLSRILI